MYAKRMIDIEIYRFLKSTTLSEISQNGYRRYIELFYWYCVDRNIDPADADVITAQEWLDSKKWANSTKIFATSAIRNFYAWKFGKTHAMHLLKVKRIETPPQRTLDEEEVMKVMASIDLNTQAGIRNIAIITLMIDTGLRANEVCNVQLARMDLKKNRLHVPIKGNRWGEAVYFDYTRHCISQWLAVRPFVAEPLCEYLFVSLGGRRAGARLTRYGLATTLERVCRKAGVLNVTPHSMRRTFATLATELGAPSRLVQVAGRWKDFRMVEHYTRTLRPEKIEPYSVINHLMGIDKRDIKP
jgi:integrase/recombinase XerD